MEETHHDQTHTTWDQIPQNVLDAGTSLKALNRKQDFIIQNNTQTDMDIRHTLMGCR
jgi:hypothetical protein